MRASLLVASFGFTAVALACGGDSFETADGAGSSTAAGGVAGSQQAGGSGVAGSGTAGTGTAGSEPAGGTTGAGAGGQPAGGASGASGGESAGAAGGVGAGAAGGPSAGAAGAPSAGAAGGPSAGAAGGPAGGTGGAPPVDCGTLTCSAGTYCNPDVGACQPCTDFSRFQFGTPVLHTPMPGAQMRLFPRVASTTGTADDVMLLRANGGPNAQGGADIARVERAGGVPFAGGQNLNCCVNKGVDDSGPLPLPASQTSATLAFVNGLADRPRYVLLDSARPYMGSVGRRIFAVGVLGSFAVDVANNDYNYVPVTLLDGGEHNYSVAFAHAAPKPRFFWMRQASGQVSLMTRTLDDDVAKVSVSVPSCAGTESLGDDLAPWVTPSGSHLLFQAACPGGSPRLYVAPTLGGQLSGPASPIDVSGLNATSLRTPSLSGDMCSLYFESGGNVFSATRR